MRRISARFSMGLPDSPYTRAYDWTGTQPAPERRILLPENLFLKRETSLRPF